MAERVRMAVSDLKIPHKGSDVAPCVTLSLGIAGRVPGLHSSPDELIGAADKALYAAKAQGRNRCSSTI